MPNSTAGPGRLLAALPGFAACVAPPSSSSSSSSSFAVQARDAAACLLTTAANGLAPLTARLTLSRLAAAGLTLLVAAFVADLARQPRYPRSLPRVGYGSGAWGTLRNWLGYAAHFNEWVEEGYRKYAPRNQPFVVPAAASRPHAVVVPRAHTAWLLDLPDHVLSAHAAHDDLLYSAYNFPDDAYAPAVPPPGSNEPPRDDHFHNRVVHRHLARHLPGLLPDIEDEVVRAVDAAFGPTASSGASSSGTDTASAWRVVNLWDAWLALVPPVTGRVLVGPALCRDPALLATLVQFADAVAIHSFALSVCPTLLHPVVGRLARRRTRQLWRTVHAHMAPVVAERLRLLNDGRSDGKSDGDGDGSEALPEDYITWHLRMAAAEGRTSECTPAAVSQRLLPVAFAALHTTVLTGFFALLDLLASDPARGYMAGIREEVAAVRASERQGQDQRQRGQNEQQQGQDERQRGQNWTKAGLARLWRTDSALRESMRVSAFATAMVTRKVVAAEGIAHPDGGWRVPRGGVLLLPLAGPHRDPALYAAPDDYDAFRFARAREAAAAAGEAATATTATTTTTTTTEARQLGMVTTSDRHLAFGHGRHACPGRFFVAHELKMVLAHLATHYEFEPLAARPPTRWLGQTVLPPLGVTVRVRRRRQG
ncbi:cytochrome p450 monooxygenase [Niveomyces insectorum RCEF 264]|uniref:Cytochrome p450 monooxygenase n=1 Tax=Niveomyces insectorum RCEF 264 TaxID=1081102 RepID=A0A167SH86_9HYPO|nr:cytochrome p450 monooxygenase [Niveomyces insectorum RCEF 264]